MTLVDYALKVANVRKDKVKFVILNGSRAIGQTRRYSDFDVMLVTKGGTNGSPKARELFGVFNGRLFFQTQLRIKTLG